MFTRNYIRLSKNILMASQMKFSTLKVSEPRQYVFHVELNRPEKLNAMNRAMWFEIGDCFRELSDNPACRVVVLSGAGSKGFTAGIDLNDMVKLGPELAEHEDIARKAKVLEKLLKKYQESMTSLEKCPKPVIAAIHGYCIGGGLNLVCAADIRYCSKDAWFQNKEVDIGMAADVGTLQRMPKIVGSTSWVNELAFTCRKFPADEARSLGFVSDVLDDKEALLKKAFDTSALIASKSPVAIQGTKKTLVYSRDHSVDDGLQHVVGLGLLVSQVNLEYDDFCKHFKHFDFKDPHYYYKYVYGIISSIFDNANVFFTSNTVHKLVSFAFHQFLILDLFPLFFTNYYSKIH